MQPKILLGIPTYKYLTSFAFGHLMRVLLDGVNSSLIKRLEIEADMYVTMARNMMCNTALELYQKEEITHLLMIDDDMIIPDGSIAALANHNVDVISGQYYTRAMKPVAYNFEPSYHFLDKFPETGVIQVDGAGAGCLLLKCEVLAKMERFFGDKWWFQNSIGLDGGEERYMGEDVFFFKRLKQMGTPAYVDCDVKLGHIGLAVVDQNLVKVNQNYPKSESPLV
jgi:hypothetical protein